MLIALLIVQLITKNKKIIFRQRRKPNRGMVKHKAEIPREPTTLHFSSELKYTDTAFNSSVGITGLWTKINFPTQGTTSTNRVADRCRIVGIEQISICYAAAVDYCRMIVIQTKGLFTSPPATTDLLQFVSPVSPLVYNSNDLYKVVVDKLFTLVPGGDSQVTKYIRTYPVLIPELRFVAGSSNVYDGQLYLLLLCINNQCSFNTNFRMWYEDGN